jgi:hypothetical protein
MLNAIRARQGLPPLPPGRRIGTPQFSQTPSAGAAASAVGEKFPRGDWRQFLKEARPSTNVEDSRSNIPGMGVLRDAVAGGPALHWEVTPEDAARFNPNDPMTRTLMGSDRAQMRDDVLRNMTPDEYMDWLGQMREQGGEILKERYRPIGPP